MTNTSNDSVILNISAIGTQPTTYKYENGLICLFITSEKGVEMPMGQRTIPLPAHSIYLFYDQKRSFELTFKSETESVLYTIQLSIDTLHHIIAKGTDELNFSQNAIFEKEQYHHYEVASEEIQTCIQELDNNSSNIFMLEAKKFEILNHYFNRKSVQTYQCPFLNQKDNVNKVRDAKKRLLHDLQKSPTIKELSKEVGLNEYNLKTGFKEIYGKPIHAYLKDFKMSKAREMILTKDYQISEIADHLGYSNVSHFIEAFKKKYNVTPKQFELGT